MKYKVMLSCLFLLLGLVLGLGFSPKPQYVCNCDMPCKEVPCKETSIMCENFTFGLWNGTLPRWDEWPEWEPEPFLWNITNDTFLNGTPIDWDDWETVPWFTNITRETFGNWTLYCVPKPYNCTQVHPDDANECCKTHCLGDFFNRFTKECGGSEW